MSIPSARKKEVRPIHPGEMLREDFLPDYRLTVSGLAQALGVSRQTVNELLRERRSVSSQMALRLSRLFGNSPEFWLNAQRAVDLWDATQEVGPEVEQIKPLRRERSPLPAQLLLSVSGGRGDAECLGESRERKVRGWQPVWKVRGPRTSGTRAFGPRVPAVRKVRFMMQRSFCSERYSDGLLGP